MSGFIGWPARQQRRGLLGVNYARVSLRLNLTVKKEGAGKDLDGHPFSEQTSVAASHPCAFCTQLPGAVLTVTDWRGTEPWIE